MATRTGNQLPGPHGVKPQNVKWQDAAIHGPGWVFAGVWGKKQIWLTDRGGNPTPKKNQTLRGRRFGTQEKVAVTKNFQRRSKTPGNFISCCHSPPRRDTCDRKKDVFTSPADVARTACLDKQKGKVGLVEARHTSAIIIARAGFIADLYRDCAIMNFDWAATPSHHRADKERGKDGRAKNSVWKTVLEERKKNASIRISKTVLGLREGPGDGKAKDGR